MLLLAFDTSTPAVTVALVELEPAARTIASRSAVASNRHGELLAPFIAQVLAEAGAAAGELAAVAVGLGPGPFTGLRVGVVTARSMGDALGVPVHGVCSLDVIAGQHDGSRLAVLTDARRKQVYWATYDDTGRCLAGPELSPPDDLAERLRGEVTHLAGAGAVLYRDRFAADFTVVETRPYPEAEVLAALVAPRVRRGEPGDDLAPLYLRRPDAQPPGRPKQVTPA